eukprot:10569887-Alexandrium_andersonii.AAC.1
MGVGNRRYFPGPLSGEKENGLACTRGRFGSEPLLVQSKPTRHEPTTPPIESDTNTARATHTDTYTHTHADPASLGDSLRHVACCSVTS